MYVQNNACIYSYNHNQRISAMQCTQECHRGTLCTPVGKSTLHDDSSCSASSSCTIQRNESISQRPGTCQQEWQKPRIIQCETSYWSYKIYLWILWPSSHRVVGQCPLPLNLGRSLWLCWPTETAKETLSHLQGYHEKACTFALLTLQGSLHAVRKPKPPNREQLAASAEAPHLRQPVLGVNEALDDSRAQSLSHRQPSSYSS